MGVVIMTIKSYLKLKAKNEYRCHQCDRVILRGSSYTNCNRYSHTNNIYSCKMHIDCIKPLIQKGWVSYLDCGSLTRLGNPLATGFGRDLDRSSPESSWDNLSHLLVDIPYT